MARVYVRLEWKIRLGLEETVTERFLSQVDSGTYQLSFQWKVVVGGTTLKVRVVKFMGVL